jgi:acyl carrier protein
MQEKLKKIFAEVLNIPINKVTDNLKYGSLPEWSSITHMALIAALDLKFDIMIDTEDVIDMSSFKKAKEILAKYGVQI